VEEENCLPVRLEGPFLLDHLREYQAYQEEVQEFLEEGLLGINSLRLGDGMVLGTLLILQVISFFYIFTIVVNSWKNFWQFSHENLFDDQKINDHK